MKGIKIHCKGTIIETGQVFEIGDDRKAKYAELLKSLDNKWSITILGNSLNNYGFNDYLIVGAMIQSIRSTHHTTYYNPYEEKWIDGNSEIPYIHLVFVEEPVEEDRQLNAGVKPPLTNGAHKLHFNYYWLQQYIGFLQRFFDTNEELFIDIPPEHTEELEDYTDYSGLLMIALQLKESNAVQQSKALMKYAESVKDDTKILKPHLCVLNIKEPEIHEMIWGFYDKERQGISIPLKQHIYKTSGFASLFYKRNSFISDVFFYSLEYILGHEVAHVARGHWNLRVKEKDYSLQRNVMMNCEINADWTSAHWMLNKFLYDTANGEPYSPVIRLTRDELIYSMSVMIFSCYLSQSWAYREDREWSDSDLSDFIDKMTATHPIYNFRVNNILGRIKQHIVDDFINKDREKVLQTKDGAPFGETTLLAFDKAVDMVLSFESAFKVNWNEDERDYQQKLHDSICFEIESRPEKEELIPFMMAFRKQAQEELDRYEQIWPEVLEKLRKHGMYFVM